MKILVTGGAGFLGSHICQRLVSKGHEVLSVNRKSYPELESLGVKTYQADICDEKAMDTIMSDVDVVFHTAAIAGVWGKFETFYNINVNGTKNIVRAMKKHGVQNLIYTSSPSVVLGMDDLCGVDESTVYPEKFHSYYGQTKCEAEKYVFSELDEKFRAVAMRPHLIWGPGDPHIFPRLAAKAREGKLKMVGDGSNLVDAIYIDNAAHGHILAMEKLLKDPSISGKAYFLGQERPVNLWSFVNQMLATAKIPEVEGQVSFKMAYRVGSILETVYRTFGIISPEPPMTRFVAVNMGKSHYFSHERAHKDLGYKPLVTIEEGLKKLTQENERKRKILYPESNSTL